MNLLIIKFQSSRNIIFKLTESPLYIGAQAAYKSPFFNSSSLNAIPKSILLIIKLKVPTIISSFIPTVSPGTRAYPYFFPDPFELCRNSPLYIAQPLFVSEKASIILLSNLETPIFKSVPYITPNSK